MKNILSFINKSIPGNTIKEWIIFHAFNETEYTKIAKTMMRYMNLRDDCNYYIDLRPCGTGCGEWKRYKPNVRKCK